jgi:hypothetical protein
LEFDYTFVSRLCQRVSDSVDWAEASSFEKISPACQAKSPQPQIADLSPQTPSASHLLAQRNAFHRRDASLQSRLFALWNPRLQRNPNSNRLC